MLFSKMVGRLFGAVVFAWAIAAVAHAGECLPPPAAPTPDTIQKLASQARDRGFLWKLSKGGHDSWLYGTMHAGKLEWTMPGPKVINALRHSELIAVELDMTDPATLEKLVQLSRQGAGQIPESFKSRFKAQLDKVCMPETAMNEMNPLLLLTTVEMLIGRESGLETAYGAEFVLIGYASAANKEIVPLETPEAQMASIIPPGGVVGNAELDDYLQQLESGNSQELMQKLTTIWSRGELAELSRYESWCHCMDTPIQRAEMKKMLDDRNGPLAGAIDTLHLQGKPVFAAVGALHMVGGNGLPALLAGKGYTVTQVEFDR